MAPVLKQPFEHDRTYTKYAPATIPTGTYRAKGCVSLYKM